MAGGERDGGHRMGRGPGRRYAGPLSGAGTVTSGAPVVMSRGGSDVRPEGGPHAPVSGAPGLTGALGRKNSVPSRGLEVGKEALPDPRPVLPPHLRARAAASFNFESFWEKDKTLCPAQHLTPPEFSSI